MDNEDDLLPISALQHWLFCPRQCALIHIEQAWAENRLTARGRQLHDRAHEAAPESRGDTRIVRALRLCSHTLGLTGQADVVELHRPGTDTPPEEQAHIPALDGTWTVYPVEYKHGQPKRNDCDRVQLCAQAMCLEEMLGVRIPAGALFYGRTRRREAVCFNETLRARTAEAARAVQTLLASPAMPAPEYSSKCRSCSLLEVCMPTRVGSARKAAQYLRRQLDHALTSDPTNEAGHEDT